MREFYLLRLAGRQCSYSRCLSESPLYFSSYFFFFNTSHIVFELGFFDILARKVEDYAQPTVASIEDCALAGNKKNTTHARDRTGISGKARRSLNSD